VHRNSRRKADTLHKEEINDDAYTSVRDFYAVFIYSCSGPSRFFTGFVSILRMTPGKASIREVVVMRLETKRQAALDALDDPRSAQEPSLALLQKIISAACTRIPLLAKPKTVDRLFEFAKVGAWTEAALALIELELPLWTVRRLAYENGEWLCSLSRQPNLPMTFDDCAEATHEVLPLAILSAFVEASRRRHEMHECVSTVPQIQPWPEEQIICCENYR
jgi:hypothetical protein